MLFGDRTFIVLLILFVMVGVYSYDRYLVEEGELSPVAQLIDFAGLADLISLPDSKITITHETFRFNAQSNLKRLQEKHNDILAQRNKLIKNRTNILNQLIAIGNNYTDEAEMYANMIKNEGDKLMNVYPDLKQIKDDLFSAKDIEDPIIKLNTYNEIKQRLFDFAATIVNDPEFDLSRLGSILENIEQILIEEDEAFMEECGTFAQCIEENLDDLEEELSILIAGIVERPGRDLGKLSLLTKQFEEEYKIYQERFDQQGIELEHSDDFIEGEFRALVKQLLLITDNDLEDLKKLFIKLENEKRIYMEDLALSQRQFKDKVSQFTDDLKRSALNSNVARRFNYNRFNSVSAYFLEDRIALAQKGASLEKDLLMLMNDRWFASADFLESLALALDVNLNRYMSDQDYALEKQSHYRSDRNKLKRIRIREEKRHEKYLKSQNSKKKQETEQKKKNSEIKRELQKMRDKSRDQGF